MTEKLGTGATAAKIDVAAEIKRAATKVSKLKNERKGINADITAERKRLKSLGIDPKEFDRAVKYRDSDADQREGLDASYATCRDALGVPFNQDELFPDDEEDQPKVH